MKSEERHRLHETEMERWGRSAEDFWEKFVKDSAKAILIGLGVVCLLAAILFWWVSSSNAAQAERWREVLSASFDNDSSKSIELFAQAANKYPNHPVGEWAALMEAERALGQGIHYSRTNRKAIARELVQAREAFNKLTDSKSELIQERRLFGLARCLETLAGVDVSEEKDAENVDGVDEAVTAYEQFLQCYPESIYASFAEGRVSTLKTDQAKDFYAWYREQNPNPDDLKTPADGNLPEGHPPIDGSATPPAGDAGDMPNLQRLEDQFNNWIEGNKNPFEEFETPAGAEKPIPDADKGPELTPPTNDEAPKPMPDADKGPELTPPTNDEAPKPKEE